MQGLSIWTAQTRQASSEWSPSCSEVFRKPRDGPVGSRRSIVRQMGTSHRVPRGRRGKRRGFYIMVVRKWVAKRARRRYRGPGYARMENRRASLLQHRRSHGQPRQGRFAKEMLRCSVFDRLVAHHRFSRIRITVAAKAQDGRQFPA